jgi:RHS repeat-associated protein
VDGGASGQYVYDALDRRVRTQNAGATYEYLYDYAGRRISSWLEPSNFGNEGRIYWGGQQIAYRAWNGQTYFEHKDMIGTERMRTNYAGSVASAYQSLPWGDGYNANETSSTGDGLDNLHFAQLDKDSESSTEHAQFRQYSSTQGRWMSPDPYVGSYDVTDPQSFNRYSYVLNNPLARVDPSGLCDQTGGLDDPNSCVYLGLNGVAGNCQTGQVSDQYGNCYNMGASGIQGGSGGAVNVYSGDDGYPVVGVTYSSSNSSGSSSNSSGGGTGSAPNSGTPTTPQPCLAQRVGDALPGAQFTGVGNAVGGHQQFNFAMNTADLAADGFSPFKVLGIFSNGYRNGSFFLQVHVNGQNGAQLSGSSGVINVQGHVDVFNPAAGYGSGLILHGIWDLGIGSLFFHHSARLDPGC